MFGLLTFCTAGTTLKPCLYLELPCGSLRTIDSFLGFGCQIIPAVSAITDSVYFLPGAPRALPLRPVLNGCQQEEKLTKDRRPDFGRGRARGSSGLQTTSHRPLALTHPVPEEEEEAEQTSFE